MTSNQRAEEEEEEEEVNLCRMKSNQVYIQHSLPG